jgi:RNA polymerase sigma-54 factor
MALTQGLQQRQSQTLAMTAELQQSLKMLQLSSIDLSDLIYNELDNNPLLALDDGNSIEAGDFKRDDSSAELTELSKDRTIENNDSLDYSNEDWSDAGTGGSRNFEDYDYEFDRTIAGEKDLREQLIEQFFIDCEDSAKRSIGVHMMDFLDESGYFIGKTHDIAENLGVTEDEVKEVLGMLQKLEPVGVFARDLAECLKIQLAEKDRLDPAMFTLLMNLEALAMKKFDILQDLCGVDREDLIDMVSEIRALNPKPALGWAHKELTPSQPDVFVKKNDDGNFTVELNNAALPKVLVNKTYFQEVSSKVKDKEEKKYLKTNLQNANFIVRALDQRANTMIKTAAAIVKHQQEFFKYGIKYLKPLTLSQIAAEIEMHESTVSRVTSNKFMVTPRGSFEMKYFFTSGVSNMGGEVASTSVKESIKEIVAAEDNSKPLSDDEITKALQKKGVKISRRTVMKYREALKIPSSYDRKNLSLYSA